MSTIDGTFTFTLSFNEDGYFKGDGNYVDRAVQGFAQSMVAGNWGVQKGHIHTSGAPKTSGEITSAA